MRFDSLKSDFVRVNKLAAPILVSFLGNYIFTLGDQAIIGRTSLEGYAAVGVVSNLLYAITGTLGILSLTLNILGSQKLGKKDKLGYEVLFNTSLTISLIIGITFQIICIYFGKGILKHLYKMEGLFLQYAYDYLMIAGFGLLLNLVIFILSAYFKSNEKTRILMIASLIANAVNLLIDYVLVFGKLGFPKLGVKGAALGTIIGLVVNVLIYFFKFSKYSFFKIKLQIHLESISIILKSYIPLLGQDFIESTGFMLIFMGLLTTLGTSITGSYNLIMAIINLIVLPLYAYGSVTTTLVAKANNSEQFKKVKIIPVISTFSVSLLILITGTIITLNSQFFCSLITNNSVLIKQASNIIMFAIGIQFFNILNQIFKSSLNAISKEKWVLIYSTAIGILTLATIYYLTRILNMKLIGVFIGYGVNYILLAIGYLLKLRTRK